MTRVWLDLRELPIQTDSRLRHELPDLMTSKNIISATLPAEDPKMIRFFARTAECGLSPWMDKSRAPERHREYTRFIYRAYDRDDLNASRYLQMIPHYRDDMQIGYITDHVWITATNLPRKLGFRTLQGNDRPACGERVKALLEIGNFNKLQFVPGVRYHFVDGKHKETPYGAGEETWYALSSDVVMPPLGPPLLKYPHRATAPGPRDGLSYITLREPGFDDAEFHYPAAEVDALGPFEVALMYENRPSSGLIVSRRFWLACEAHGLPCDFKPVRIDEE